MTRLLSRPEAAQYLGISVRTLDRRTSEGKIRYVSDRRGARVTYREKDLEDYVNKHICRR
jgi:excisionase family DNA binding protein